MKEAQQRIQEVAIYEIRKSGSTLGTSSNENISHRRAC